MKIGINFHWNQSTRLACNKLKQQMELTLKATLMEMFSVRHQCTIYFTHICSNLFLKSMQIRLRGGFHIYLLILAYEEMISYIMSNYQKKYIRSRRDRKRKSTYECSTGYLTSPMIRCKSRIEKFISLVQIPTEKALLQ